MKTKRLLASIVYGLSLTLVSLWLLTAGSVMPVYADTYSVTNTDPSGPGSLRQAIIDANGNPGHDTIDFGITGTIVLTDALPAIADDLTITGPGAEQLAVSGNNQFRVFEIDSSTVVTITGVTVRDGNAVNSNGGGIWSAGTLHLGSVQIASNIASGLWPLGLGGGVYIEQGSATLSGTQVASNSATSDGGGVFVYEGSVTLNGTQVSSNSAEYGGGVCADGGGSMTLNETQVGSNSAEYGGGMYVWWGNVTLNETQVGSNSASEDGGGVFVDGSSAMLSVSGGEIDSNSASNGGGVYVWWGNVTLNETQVGSNSAFDDGGGMHVNGGSVTLSGTQVVSNSASDGGGVFVSWGNVMLSETQVVSNSASWGGGVLVDGGSMTLNGGKIGSNSAFDYGGGVFVDGGSVTLSRTQVVSNSVYYVDGGGVYVNSGSATLNGTQVVGNSAYRGGGLYQGNGSITTTNGCIVNNSDTSVVRASGSTLVATGNWWGAADGPSGVGPGSGDSVSTGVDYSGFLTTPPPGCPTLLPDLVIVKTVIPTVAAPGQAITYTLAFHYAGMNTATGIVITDTIPVSLTHRSLNVDSNVDITATSSVSYVWQVEPLDVGEWGIITITGILSNPLAAGVFSNTAVITTTAVDSDSSNNSDSASVTVLTMAPEITVHPLDLAFGDQDVDAGATVSQTVTITNDGTANLSIYSVSLTGADVGEFTIEDDTGETSLAPGSTRTVQVSFDPTITGTKSASLTIQSDDSDKPSIDVALSGTGTSVTGQPGYGSTPAPGSPINVGTANVGSTVSTTLTISETGEATLVVTPTLSGADAGDFSTAPSTLTIPDGGAAQDLTIFCTPSASGTLVTTLAATLTVVHNAPGSPALYPLSCTGTALQYIYLPLVLRNAGP